jgi:hypothetical protein
LSLCVIHVLVPTLRDVTIPVMRPAGGALTTRVFDLTPPRRRNPDR